MLTYRVDAGACEITMIESFDPGRGIGSALLRAVVDAARAAGADRVWLVTTNDNLRARAWYERRGFRVTAVREGAVDEARAAVEAVDPAVERGDGPPDPRRDRDGAAAAASAIRRPG